MTYIYILKHPLTNEIRYVGQTNNPKVRLYNHIHLVNNSKTHTKSWIKSLLSQGLEPAMEIIEKCLKNASEREKYWISYYIQHNCNLCNHTIGGECGTLSPSHVIMQEQKVLNALKMINSGKKVILSEKEAGLSNGYLSKVRKKEIEYLKHIQVPYYRNLKKLKIILVTDSKP